MENKNDKKMTYEQLEKYCNYLVSQLDESSEKMRQAQFSEMLARLNFEFKVLELAQHFPQDYVEKCSADIQRMLVMEEPQENGEQTIETEDA